MCGFFFDCSTIYPLVKLYIFFNHYRTCESRFAPLTPGGTTHAVEFSLYTYISKTFVCSQPIQTVVNNILLFPIVRILFPYHFKRTKHPKGLPPHKYLATQNNASHPPFFFLYYCPEQHTYIHIIIIINILIIYAQYHHPSNSS